MQPAWVTQLQTNVKNAAKIADPIRNPFENATKIVHPIRNPFTHASEIAYPMRDPFKIHRNAVPGSLEGAACQKHVHICMFGALPRHRNTDRGNPFFDPIWKDALCEMLFYTK